MTEFLGNTDSSTFSNIDVYDAPLRSRLTLSTLPKSLAEDDSVEAGYVVSEVGPPRVHNLMTWADPFIAYDLREPRIRKLPNFVFGCSQLNQAYSAFTAKVFSAPAAGAKITINPWVTDGQNAQLALYRFVSAEFYYIIHTPAPLGTGIYLQCYAPEVDATIVTRGIRWKPSVTNTVAVHLPWSSDIPQVPRVTGRAGQPGGSIVISTVEDNSITSLQTPLNITVWCCVTNINLTGLMYGTPGMHEIGGFNFMPVANPPPREVIHQNMDSGPSVEVTGEAEGMPTDQTEDATPAVPIAPSPEKQAIVTISPSIRSASNKTDSGHLATKWYDFQTITVGAPDLNVWKIVNINPYTITQDGEAFNLPWKRNVWTSGSNDAGYMHTLYVQVNIARSPQISGVIAFMDSRVSSSQYLVSFGEKCEIPLIPVPLIGINSNHIRDWNSPWLRTSECTCQLAYKLVALNRTADVAETNIKIMIRPGHSNFQVPTKPVRRAPPAFGKGMLKELKAALLEDHIHQNMDEGANPASHITPLVSVAPEETVLHEDLGDEEDLDLDEFPVVVFDGVLTQNTIKEIPLVLPIIPDLETTDPLENAITQKFNRFANIVPRGGGPYGPVVGSYTIKSRLPTSIAGEIEHVCLPGDMSEDAALMIFGLSSILGMAGSALASIGGPLMSGIMNTVPSLISGALHSIGGGIVSGMADGVVTILGGTPGSQKPKPKPEATQPSKPNKPQRPNRPAQGGNRRDMRSAPSPMEMAQPSGNPAAITGDIPISRCVEFLKPIASNYTANPIFPTLLVNAKHFVGYNGEAIEEVPIQVVANMRHTKVERNVFNRSYEIATTMTSDLILADYTFPRILEGFVSHPLALKEGTRQNDWFKRFLYILNRNRSRGDIRRSITLSELREIPDNLVAEQPINTLFVSGTGQNFWPPDSNMI